MNAAETKKIGHAYVALGSNLENPILQVQQAIEALKGLRGTCLVGQSSLYRSAPIGRLDQSDFINAVAYIETTLSPHCLLQALLEIELHQGRVRESLNAPRTLDLVLQRRLCAAALPAGHEDGRVLLVKG